MIDPDDEIFSSSLWRALATTVLYVVASLVGCWLLFDLIDWAGRGFR